MEWLKTNTANYIVRQYTRHPACMNTPVQENCGDYKLYDRGRIFLMIIIAILLMILHGITVLFSGEDLILLVREFQSLIEEGENEFK